MLFILMILVVALTFEFINGFHDTANAIATVVSTKVLSPGQAVMMSAVFNFVGALAGTAVASTIGKGLISSEVVGMPMVLCALLGAIAWNLLTWWVGLPSSSSHALIGGLCGSALASAHGNWSVIKWSILNPTTHHWEGLWPKVVSPMVAAPLCGIFIGFLIMAALLVVLQRCTPGLVNSLFGKLQLLSAAWMSYSHGTNDAQKTMGIIALTLFTATKANQLDDAPSFLHFLKTPDFQIALWVKAICALTMAAGTAVGGWRIIKTLAQKVVKIQKIHGFAAQSTAAAIIQTASHWGIPLSTTHVISGAIMGAGSTKGFNAVKWEMVERMVWAWIFTLPISALIAYLFVHLFHLLGLR